jgi:putative transposase
LNWDPTVFFRYIISWTVRTTMRAEDVTDTHERALRASGCDTAPAAHAAQLLSDNGPSYIAADLAEWIQATGTQSMPA